MLFLISGSLYPCCSVIRGVASGCFSFPDDGSLSPSELHLMFSLMDKVPSGIEPMLKDLEEHIMSAGLADMVASAETITSVSVT